MIPSAGTPVTIRDLIAALLHSCDFEKEAKELLGVKQALAVNSGTTSFYIILSALKKLYGKKEIIMPAYTAPSLVLPIKKAGLEYRLVDMSLDTFNMDMEKTADSVSDNTLAVLCVHMFGLPANIESLNSKPFVIEDAASSFGSKIGSKYTGTLGDIGFVSFNRGKNVSTVSGGLIVTDNRSFMNPLSAEIENLPTHGSIARLKIYLKAFGLSLAVRPWFYTIFSNAISKFKYTTLHEDFDSFRYTRFQGSLGCRLLKKSGRIFKDREEKGRFLINALKQVSGIRIPSIPDNCSVVFNQFPMLVKDAEKRTAVTNAILKAGVEATILYDRPIHKIYNEGSGQKYPNAEYMADRLILIPVHNYFRLKALHKVADAVKKAVAK